MGYRMKKLNFNEKKAKEAVKLLLESFGEDLNREGLRKTPERVAEFYKEALCGNNINPLDIASVHYSDENYEEITLLKDITFHSICEHHLLPFWGKAHIAYIPKKNKILGISKFIRLVEIFSARLQLQERLSKQIADAIMEAIDPRGVMVVLEAEHMCMSMRGVKKPGATIVTSVMRGIFLKDIRSRSEVTALLKGK
jgi:GTP cyclohydrolase I